MKILLSILLFFTFSYYTAQTIDTVGVINYLKRNSEKLELEKEGNVKLFNKFFYENQLFLFGENHGSANPQLADLLLFKNLHKHAGVRHYIAEVDVVKAWMLNNYLQDGNKGWLQKVFGSWVNDTAQWASKENYKKYELLRSFYQSLPEKQRFTIVGIDVIQDYSLLNDYTSYFLLNKKSKQLQLYLDSLQYFSETTTFQNKKQLGQFARRLLPILQNNTTETRKVFTKNTSALLHYVTSLSFINAGMLRDSIMFRNYDSYLTNFNIKEKKMYGFLGFFHCLQISYEKSYPFAALVLRNRPTYVNKIASIQMFALESETMIPYMAQLKLMMPEAFVDKLRSGNPNFVNSKKYVPYTLSNDDQMMKAKGIELLAKTTNEGSCTLISLKQNNSPFSNTKLMAEVTGFQTIRITEANKYTSDAFQYILLFRGSPAASPIEKLSE